LEKANEWEEEKRNQAFLLRDKALEEAEAMNLVEVQKEPRLTELQIEFIRESQSLRSFEIKQQRINIRRLRLLVIGLGIILVMAVIAGFIAVQQAREARKQRDTTYSSLLSVISKDLKQHVSLNSLLAVAALGLQDQPQSRDAVLWNLQNYRFVESSFIVHPLGSVNDVSFSSNGRLLITGGNYITIWDYATKTSLDDHLVPVYQSEGIAVVDVSFGPTLEKDVIGAVWVDPSEPAGATVLVDVSDMKEAGFHEGLYLPVNLSFHPDGNLVAIVDTDNSIIVRDIFSEDNEVTFKAENSGRISCIEFSPDSVILATGTYDRNILLWDVSKGEPIGEPLRGHKNAIMDIAFSPDGKILASSSEDKTIILWDIETRSRIGDPLRGHDGTVTSVAFSPDGSLLASASEDKSIILWNTTTGERLYSPLVGHTGAVTSIAFHPQEENIFASGSTDGSVIIWNLDAPSPFLDQINPYRALLNNLASLKTPDESSKSNLYYQAPVLSQASSSNGRVRAFGDLSGRITLWDVESSKRIGQLINEGSSFISGLKFSPDDKVLVSKDAQNRIVIWDLSSKEPIEVIQNPNSIFQFTYNSGLAISRDLNFVAVQTEQGLFLWDITAKKIIEEIDGWGNAFEFNSRNAYLATITATFGGQKTLHLISLTGGEDKRIEIEHKGWARKIVFAPNDSVLAVVIEGDEYIPASDGVVLVDLKNHSVIGGLYEPNVSSISFNEEGTQVTTSHMNGLMITWDIKTQEIIKQSQAEQELNWNHALKGPIRDMDFSSDGLLITETLSDEIIITNVQDSKVVGQRQFEINTIKDVDLDSDENKVYISTVNDKILMWDINSNTIKEKVPCDNGLLTSIAVKSENIRIMGKNLPFPNELVYSCTGNDFGIHYLNMDGSDVTLRFETLTDLWVSSMASGRDGNLFTIAKSNGFIELIDMNNNTRSIANDYLITAMALNPENEILAAATDAGNIIFWDIQSGNMIGAPIQTRLSSVSKITFTSDGNGILYTDSHDINYMSLSFEGLTETLCYRAGRSLTENELQTYFSSSEHRERFKDSCLQ
jgi:WD40 repeat protein